MVQIESYKKIGDFQFISETEFTVKAKSGTSLTTNETNGSL